MATNLQHWVLKRNLVAGIILSLAILDHTRLFFHYWNTSPVDPSHPDLALFFTRFSAHFFAPAAFLLTGIELYRQSLAYTRKENTLRWIRNGVLLIATEVVINNFLYTFDPFYRTVGLFIVGMMGISMILLALLQYLPRTLLIIIVIVILIGHNLLDGIQVQGQSAAAILWYVLHQQQYIVQGGQLFTINYTILPWTALLFAGYLLAPFVLQSAQAIVRKRAMITGLLLCTLFFLLRFLNIYGDLHSWTRNDTPTGTVVSFFNITKYPASLDYLCITIGPLLLLYAAVGTRSLKASRIFMAFGQKPLFIYLFSTLLIHLAALVTVQVGGGSWRSMIITPASYKPGNELKDYGFSLGIVYGIWVLVMAALYVVIYAIEKIKRPQHQSLTSPQPTRVVVN